MRAYLRVDCGGISCTKNSIARSEGLSLVVGNGEMEVLAVSLPFGVTK